MTLNQAVSRNTAALVRYDAAVRTVAEARRVDEVKGIRDKAVAMQIYAEQARDRTLIEDAVEIRLRAERRAGELLAEMAKNKGAVPGKTGRKGRPVLDPSPKLSDLGVSKSQSSRWQRFADLDDKTFELHVVAARKKALNGLDGVHREIKQEAEREAYTSRIEQGCTADDLHALAASGYRAGVIYVDVPSCFETWSDAGKLKAPARYYDVLDLDKLKAMGPLIRSLAAKHCAMFFWASGALAEQAHELIRVWDFAYKTWAFVWVKTNPTSEITDLEHLTTADLRKMGMGYSTRANVEVVLLATRSAPTRLNADVQQVVLAPAMEHSAKPEEVRRRIERLYPGPYLELFGRKPVTGWTVWGNEVEREQFRAAPAEAEVA